MDTEYLTVVDFTPLVKVIKVNSFGVELSIILHEITALVELELNSLEEQVTLVESIVILGSTDLVQVSPNDVIVTGNEKTRSVFATTVIEDVSSKEGAVA